MRLLLAFWFILETLGVGDVRVHVIGPFDTREWCEKVADTYNMHSLGNNVAVYGPITYPKQIDGQTCWFTEPAKKSRR